MKSPIRKIGKVGTIFKINKHSDTNLKLDYQG